MGSLLTLTPNYGQRLRMTREHLQLEQNDLARLLDIPAGTLSDHEKRKVPPRGGTAWKLARLLEERYGVSSDWLLSGQPVTHVDPESRVTLRYPYISTTDSDVRADTLKYLPQVTRKRSWEPKGSHTVSPDLTPRAA